MSTSIVSVSWAIERSEALMRSAITPRIPRRGICSVGACDRGGAAEPSSADRELRSASKVRTCAATLAREMRPSPALAGTRRRSTPSRSASWRAANVAGGCAGAPGSGAADPAMPAGPAAGAVARASFAARTSRSVMRPLGPLPANVAISTPSSRASRLAAGDARIRSPGARTGAVGTAWGEG